MKAGHAIAVLEDIIHGVASGEVTKDNINVELGNEALGTLFDGLQSPLYDERDAGVRYDFFSEAYTRVAIIDIPTPPNGDEVSEVPDDEYWLENAAYHAQIAMMDALAGLTDITHRKAYPEVYEETEIEDDEGYVFDDEA